MNTRKTIATALLAVTTLALPQVAFAQAAPDLGHAPYEWDHFFPIWGQDVADKGMKLPLPWGAGLNYAYADQQISIDEVSIAVNDSEQVDITEFIEFESVRSRVHVVNARFDLWLFPFLNVYGLGLFTPKANTDVVISEPFKFDAGATQTGVGGGFGATAAFGLGGFFGTVDMNWTWNNMSNLDGPVKSFILTPRVGRNFGEVGGIRVVAWVGAMRQRIGSQTNGSIALDDAVDPDSDLADRAQDWYDGLSGLEQAIVDPIIDRLQDSDAIIHYDLKKQIKQKWNMTLGGELGFNDRIQLRAEVGFIGRTQVIAGFNYRFGIFSAPKKAPGKAAPTPSKGAAASPKP